MRHGFLGALSGYKCAWALIEGVLWWSSKVTQAMLNGPQCILVLRAPHQYVPTHCLHNVIHSMASQRTAVSVQGANCSRGASARLCWGGWSGCSGCSEEVECRLLWGLLAGVLVNSMKIYRRGEYGDSLRWNVRWEMVRALNGAATVYVHEALDLRRQSVCGVHAFVKERSCIK